MLKKYGTGTIIRDDRDETPEEPQPEPQEANED